jgi:hypothetical protein
MHALRLAFCTCLRQVPIGVGNPVRLAASAIAVVSFGLLVYTEYDAASKSRQVKKWRCTMDREMITAESLL